MAQLILLDGPAETVEQGKAWLSLTKPWLPLAADWPVEARTVLPLFGDMGVGIATCRDFGDVMTACDIVGASNVMFCKIVQPGVDRDYVPWCMGMTRAFGLQFTWFIVDDPLGFYEELAFFCTVFVIRARRRGT